MIFASLVSRIKDSLEKRRRYKRLAAEIMDLSDRDIADLNADRSEMLRYVHWRVYRSA